MNPKKKITLSHSGLGILDDCPRCFWLQYNEGLRWPEAFASRLPNRFDSIIKGYFDRYRSVGSLPEFLNGKMRGRLENPLTVSYYYNLNERFSLTGKLDECLITPDGFYAPVDHKTTSSDPRYKDPHPAYQKQVDMYAFLLEANNKPSLGYGYLIFYYPDENQKEIDQGFRFVIETVRLTTHPEAARERFLRGVEALERPMPAATPSCKFCTYVAVNQNLTNANNGNLFPLAMKTQ